VKTKRRLLSLNKSVTADEDETSVDWFKMQRDDRWRRNVGRL